MRYWVQTKAPAGNWVDSVGVSDYAQAESYAKASKEPARVIERVDREVWPVDERQDEHLQFLADSAYRDWLNEESNR